MKLLPLIIFFSLYVASDLFGQRVEGVQAAGNEVLAGIGLLNVLDNTERRVAGMMEVRLAPMKWRIRPWIGVTYSENNTYLLSGGLVYTIKTHSGLKYSIGSAPSYYHRGYGKDLGSDLNFYSFGEIGWAFREHSAISMRMGHISNCGIKSSNPGTEVAMLGYSFAW